MIVLDTHAWIWWVSNPEHLSRTARTTIERAVKDRQAYLSCISVWEVAMLVEKGRLKLTMGVADWVAASEALPHFTFVPVDARIALRAVLLPPPFHADPADRMIAATAATLGARLVSKDTKMRACRDVQIVW